MMRRWLNIRCAFTGGSETLVKDRMATAQSSPVGRAGRLDPYGVVTVRTYADHGGLEKVECKNADH